ncbi:MAG: bifunctional SulP family inorganic anion transporter/carbonic anhydrase [Planctomycetota bacterium]
MNSAPVATLTHEGTSRFKDLIASLPVFFVALPLCLGIAQASGAPPFAGLVAGIIGGIVVGLLSGSHISVTGPAAGLTAIVLAQIQGLGSFEAFLMAVVLAGVIQLGLGFARAGALANYFPSSVIKGLLAAIGIIIILKQIPHLIGYDVEPEGSEAFVEPDGQNTFTALLSALSNVLPGAALVGLSSLVLAVVWDRTPLKKTMPSALIAVLFGTVLSLILMKAQSSWAIVDSHLVSVPVVGQDGVRWGDLITLPDFSRAFEPAVLMAAVTLAVIASLETLLTLEATEKLDPQRRPAPPNRELLAQGIGNTLSGLVGGLPMTSVIVRSSVNVNAGAQTRLSAITHGVLLLGTVLLIPTVINTIPKAALAAVLVATGWKLASPQTFRSMWRQGKTQFIPFIITILAIVGTDLLKGVLIGLAVSLFMVLVGNMKHGFRVLKEAHVHGIVHRVELVGQATFLNRAALLNTLASFKRGEQVIIDARLADYLDSDMVAIIREFTDETAPRKGVVVSMLGFKNRYDLKDQVQYVDVSTREVQSAASPLQVLQTLREGNERFVSGRRLNRDLMRQVDQTAAGQHPLAVVLGCIDSRAPVELIFDAGIGDMFIARLAGNVASPKALGSIEFACKVAGARLILVLGHTRCGAVKAACDFVAKGLDPVEATGLTNLPSITDPISEAVRMETTFKDRRDASNEAFVDRVAAINVRNAMRWIQDNSPTISKMLATGEVALVGGMYDIKTGRVDFLDEAAAVGIAAPLSAVIRPS